jgi:hypothetical protein
MVVARGRPNACRSENSGFVGPRTLLAMHLSRTTSGGMIIAIRLQDPVGADTGPSRLQVLDSFVVLLQYRADNTKSCFMVLKARSTHHERL